MLAPTAARMPRYKGKRKLAEERRRMLLSCCNDCSLSSKSQSRNTVSGSCFKSVLSCLVNRRLPESYEFVQAPAAEGVQLSLGRRLYARIVRALGGQPALHPAVAGAGGSTGRGLSSIADVLYQVFDCCSVGGVVLHYLFHFVGGVHYGGVISAAELLAYGCI